MNYKMLKADLEQKELTITALGEDNYLYKFRRGQDPLKIARLMEVDRAYYKTLYESAAGALKSRV